MAAAYGTTVPQINTISMYAKEDGSYGGQKPQSGNFYGMNQAELEKKYGGTNPGAVPSGTVKMREDGTPIQAAPAQIEDDAPVIVDLPSAAKNDEDGGQLIYPEVAMKAVVSSSDVNRIVCNGDIRDVIFSKEKGLKAQAAGKSLYVKFFLKEDEVGKIKYATKPVEMYVVCGENTFNIILFPQKVPSQTIRLQSGSAERIKKNTSLFAGLPYEKKIQTLIKNAYDEDYPESFQVVKKMEEVKAFRDIKVFLTKVIRVEGEGFAIKEFLLLPGIDIEVSEQSFLGKDFSTAPVAVSLETLKLQRGVKSRLFVIERTPETDGGNGL